MGIAVLVAAIAVVAWPVTAPRSHVPAGLQRSLDAKVGDIETRAGEVSACESTGAAQCTYTCTAHTFDLEPQNATTIDQVTVAYAVLFCADTDSNDINSSSQDVVALPLASPSTMSSLPDDATWTDVVKVFPPHAAGAAWWYYTDGVFTLRDRLDGSRPSRPRAVTTPSSRRPRSPRRGTAPAAARPRTRPRDRRHGRRARDGVRS